MASALRVGLGGDAEVATISQSGGQLHCTLKARPQWYSKGRASGSK